ncbi:hypothetical protein [Microbacterium sp. A84]|uniref:hypothetical protein n=1 Tax=Microbacterium sp. A84 TaxID=3450715 RepID=UPI003F434EBD
MNNQTVAQRGANPDELDIDSTYPATGVRLRVAQQQSLSDYALWALARGARTQQDAVVIDELRARDEARTQPKFQAFLHSWVATLPDVATESDDEEEAETPKYIHIPLAEPSHAVEIFLAGAKDTAHREQRINLVASLKSLRDIA